MRRPRTKYSAAALAALWLLAPIMGYAHMLLVRHAQCPEHGDLIHLDESKPALHGDGGPIGGRSGASPDVMDSDHESESHGHDHCETLATRKVRAPSHAVASASHTMSAPARHPVDDRPLAAAPFALFLLAPKNSPPA